MVLKYEKNLKKKIKNVSEVNEFNAKVIQESPMRGDSSKQKKSKVSGQKSPNLMPFKSPLTSEEKAILRGEAGLSEAPQSRVQSGGEEDGYQD